MSTLADEEAALLIEAATELGCKAAVAATTIRTNTFSEEQKDGYVNLPDGRTFWVRSIVRLVEVSISIKPMIPTPDRYCEEYETE